MICQSVYNNHSQDAGLVAVGALTAMIFIFACQGIAAVLAQGYGPCDIGWCEFGVWGSTSPECWGSGLLRPPSYTASPCRCLAVNGSQDVGIVLRNPREEAAIQINRPLDTAPNIKNRVWRYVIQ